MKRLKLLLPLLGLPLLGRAQTEDQTRQMTNVFDSGFSPVARGGYEVQGSPFLLTAWAPTKPVAAPLKYDVVRQELRVRRSAGDSVTVPTAQVQEFTLTGPQPRRFVRVAGTPDGFAEVISPGPHLMLLKYWEKVVEKSAAGGSGYGSTSTVSAYADRAKYYLRGPNGKQMEVRPKRAGLQEALAAYPAALQALKARKGSLSSEAELRAAVTALDALVTAAP